MDVQVCSAEGERELTGAEGRQREARGEWRGEGGRSRTWLVQPDMASIARSMMSAPAAAAASCVATAVPAESCV